MSFYVIWVCFSLWFLTGRCFYEILWEAFFLSSVLFAHDILSSIFSPAGTHAISHILKQRWLVYKNYGPREICVLSFGPVPVCTGLCLQWDELRGTSTPTVQISPHRVHLQVTNQTVLSLIQHWASSAERWGCNSQTTDLRELHGTSWIM